MKYREILHSNNKLLQLHGFSKRAFFQGIEINQYLTLTFINSLQKVKEIGVNRIAEGCDVPLQCLSMRYIKKHTPHLTR